MASTVNGPSVLIVADDPLARAGLVALLADRTGCTVAGQATSEDDLPAILEVYRPEVVLWDLGWDPAPALDHLADLRDAGLPIVALLLNEGQTAQVWAAGARGILRRDSSASVLGASINAVAEGLVVLDPELAAEVPVSPDLGHAPPPAGDLTAREREVLGLVAEGLANKSIAQRLGISEHTVKFHMNAIMGKLGVQSRTEAVTRATRLGLIIL